VNVAEEQGVVDPLLGASKEPRARHVQLSGTRAATVVTVVVADLLSFDLK
jgi:hypothetical protein